MLKSLLKRSWIMLAFACLVPLNAAADSIPSGERMHGQAVVEPAYDDMTGTLVYLQTPSRLAPLSPTNVINNVNQHAAAPLFLVVYPPGTPGTFNCMGVPGNCPDHGGVVATLGTQLFPDVYGTDPTLVPGHDHLVGVAKTGGDFNAAWHVYLEYFTATSAVSHITTLSQLQAAWNSGAIATTQSGLGVDTGITFLCSIVSQASYLAGTAIS